MNGTFPATMLRHLSTREAIHYIDCGLVAGVPPPVAKALAEAQERRGDQRGLIEEAITTLADGKASDNVAAAVDTALKLLQG